MKPLAGFCVLALLLLGCSSPNESANKLFVEATGLLQESFAEESADPDAALAASEKALNKIEKITRSYPSSDLAVKLVQRQTVFNELSLTALQDRQNELQGTAKAVHDATESPQALAFWLVGHASEDLDRQLAFRYLIDVGDTKQALEVANSISDRYGLQKARTLKEIAAALAEAGDTNQAQTVFTQAIQAANSFVADSSGSSYKTLAMEDIVTALVKAGYTIQALQVVNSISYENELEKARALRDIATASAKAGDTKRAQTVFTQALQVANSINDKNEVEKAWALRDIAAALAEAGDTKQAQTVFTQALQVANGFRFNQKGSTLKSIAIALIESGETTQALEISNSLLKLSDYPVSDSVDIAVALAEAGKTTQAFEIVNTPAIREGVGDDFYRNVVLKRISNAVHKTRAVENVSVNSAVSLLYETDSNGRHVPVKQFTKEQLRLTRYAILAGLNAKRFMKEAS